jgi:hypothetical protein
MSRVQADQPGQLETEVESQPVITAAQADARHLFRLLQAVVQRAPVQSEPLGARLRVASQIEVGFQRREDRVVSLVEKRGQAGVEAGRRLRVGRQLSQCPEHAQILPAGGRAGGRYGRGHPRGLPGLTVGQAGVREDRRVPDAGHHRRLHAVLVQPHKQARASGRGQLIADRKAVVMSDQHAMIGVGQTDHVPRPSPPGHVPQALGEHRLRQWHRRARRPHHDRDHRSAKAAQAAVIDVAHRVGP